MPSPEDAVTIKAHTDAVDHVAKEHEQKWGVGRLPLLVSPELAAKFARQQQRQYDALEAAWNARMLTRDQLDAVINATAGMTRAWLALDAAASEAGARPLSVEVWEARMSDGSVLAIVKDNANAAHVIASGRCLNVWTLEEIVRAVEHMPEAVQQAKVAFPGAKVLPERERFRGLRDDPLPHPF